MNHRHVLSVDKYDRGLIDELFNHARMLSAVAIGIGGNAPPMVQCKATGKTLVNLFYEPSTRTSSSFHAAMLKLGGNVIPINDVNYSSVSKGENLEDTVRTMASYADLIVLRHPEKGAVDRAAAVSPVPIINGGDGVGEHPTQALLDLYTIQSEHGVIDGLTVTLMGDLKHGRTVHSLVKLLRLFDVKINFVAPKCFSMPEEYVRPDDGVFTELDDAVIGTSDVIYLTRVQWERFTDSAEKPSEYHGATYKYALTLDHMANAKDKMIVMHPFPRVDELDPAIDSDPRAAYFRQMKNGLWVRMAIIDKVFW